jgi:hypothetical protein
MFTANLAGYKTQQDELLRQAENYRLVKLAEGPNTLFSSIVNLLGKLMVRSGRQLLTLTEAAQ